MPKGIMVVQSSPADAEKDAAYNEWYSGTHVPELLAIPGFVSARRYRVAGGAKEGQHSYLAVYEIEADDLTVPVKEIRARSASGQTTSAGDLVQADPPAVVTLYELID